MKKILLLLIGGLLFACMAGSAMAETIVDEKLIQTNTPNDVVVVNGDSPTSISLDLTKDNLLPYGASNIEIYMSGKGYTVTMPSGSPFYGATIKDLNKYTKLGSIPAKIYTLQVKNSGATGPVTLTVKVDGRYTCS